MFALAKNAGYPPSLALTCAVHIETLTSETESVVSTATRLLVVQSFAWHLYI